MECMCIYIAKKSEVIYNIYAYELTLKSLREEKKTKKKVKLLTPAYARKLVSVNSL